MAVLMYEKLSCTYELKCPAATKIEVTGAESKSTARLDIYTLNSDGNALLAELSLPGVLHANVLLAGSRKVMNKVVRDLVTEAEEEHDGDLVGENTVEGDDNPNDEPEVAAAAAEEDEEDDEDESESEDEMATKRSREFEKNSFRSPKFWIKWQGELLQPASQSDSDSERGLVTDTGYLVFSGNDCSKFQGTLSCASLGWDNVKVNGWKANTKSARDFAFSWHEER